VGNQILLGLVVTLAFVVKRLMGFGNTLITNTFFLFLAELRFAAPAELLLNVPTNLALAWKARSRIDVRFVLTASVFVLAGILGGALILRGFQGRTLKVLLGLFVAAESLYALARKPKPATVPEMSGPSAREAPVRGPGDALRLTASGLSLGLFGVGAVLAAFLARRFRDRDALRGTLCAVFFLDNHCRFGTYAVLGLYGRETLRTALGLYPFVAAGFLIGHVLDGRIPERLLFLGIRVLLIGSGAALTATNLVG
jgi:hypothetical protein